MEAKTRIRRHFWYVAILTLFSLAFLFFYSYNSSPLYSYFCSGDSAYFISMGRAVVNGAVPYLDFFDIKGPIMFFIQALGQWIYPGKMGTFLVQIPFFLTSVYLLYATALLFVNRKKALVSVCMMFFLLLSTFDFGNLTEEYSLPFLCLCLYFALRCIKRGMEGHPPFYAAVYGLSFAFLALIRLTNAAVIGAIVLYFVLDLLIKKQYKNLLWNVLAFFGGAALVVVPIFAYFFAHGALDEMLYSTFVFPYLYAQDGVDTKTWVTWAHLALKVSPAVLLFIVSVFYYRIREKRIGLLLGLSSILLIAALSLGFNYLHYFTLTAPLFVLALVLLFDLRFASIIKQHWILLTAFCGVLLCVLGYYSVTDVSRVQECIGVAQDRGYYERENERLASFFAQIPAEQRDQVYLYNANTNVAYFMDIPPYYKYSDFQEIFVSVNPEVRNQINTMMRTKPPKWVLANTKPVKNTEFFSILEADYELVGRTKMDDTEDYLLYRKH